MIAVFDDFPLADEDRKLALEAPYSILDYGWGGFPGWEVEIGSPAHQVTEDQFAWLQKRIPFPRIMAWRAGYRPYLKDAKQPTFIHTDFRVSKFTGILFLNPPNQEFGLSFWKHKVTHLQEITMEPTPELSKYLDDDGTDPTKWELVAHVPSHYRRFVIFPSGYFHSRWPQDAQETTIEDCRLVKVFFLA